MIRKRGVLSSTSSNTKKGQVTVFIIVGIALLLIFTLILFLTKTFAKDQLNNQGEPVIEDVPQEFKPVQSFTQSCLEQVGRRGLRILGEQGGYIYPDLIGQFSAVNPTDADGIDLQPMKIPYWHYNGEPNTELMVKFGSHKPALYSSEDKEFSIEAQLENYVNEKLASCLNEYAAFAGQGFEIEASLEDKETTVNVKDETVNFFLVMNVKANKGNAQVEMTKFFIKVPLRLKDYYDTASTLLNSEREFSFMERQTLDLISTFSAVDKTKLPPTSEIKFEVSPSAVWTEPAVKEDFQEMLISYVPALRMLESNNFYRYQYAVSDLSRVMQKNYDNMILPYEIPEGLDVNFDYHNWPIYFNSNNDQGAIKPQSLSANFNILNFAMQHYYTVYDLSYPVLITIRDENALNGEGYNFVIALESNIRNNEPVSVDASLLPPISVNERSLICDENKRSTEPIAITVVDSFTHDPLQAVQVGFSIPESDNCILGETNAAGEFEGSYPAVYGGTGSLIKEGYLNNFYPIDTYEYKEESGIFGYAVAELSQPVIEMHNIKKIPVQVKKKIVQKCIGSRCFGSGIFSSSGEEIISYRPEALNGRHSWQFTNSAAKLKDTEQAVITLRRVGNENELISNPEFGTAISVSGENTQEIQLVPGLYEVQGVLMLNQEVIFPKEERCYDILPFGILEQCFTIPKTDMNQFVSGEIGWTNQTNYLRITPDELYNAKSIEFYIPSAEILDVPKRAHQRIIEDMEAVNAIKEASALDIRSELEPKFR